MKNQLTDQEILRLFTFVEKKGVKYIDVQHEIVDHLASDIELSKEVYPKFNFDEHINLAFNKFPKDFRKLIRSKEKSMNRYWQKRTMSYIKSYFKLPTLAFSSLLYFSIVLGTLHLGKPFIVPVLGFMTLAIIYTLVKSYTNSNIRTKEKKYLVIRMYLGQTTTMLFLPICLLNIFHVFNLKDIDAISQSWFVYLLTGLVVFTLMWCHASLKVFPKMLQQEIETKYPYLTLAN